jgi:autotransporter-associated beta strand protein
MNRTYCRLHCYIALAICLLASIQSQQLYGQITVPTGTQSYSIMSGTSVTVQSFSTIKGNVYSAGNIDIGAAFGWTPQNQSGSFFSRGSINVASSGSTVVNGNLVANSNITIASTFPTINGNLQYGGTGTGGTVTGTRLQFPDSVPSLTFPTPTTFTPGTTNIAATSNQVLAPGSYGAITFPNTTTLTLSSGDYYIRSLSSPSTSFGLQRLNLNLTNGPIRVFASEDISIATWNLEVYVNGQSIPYNSLVPIAEQSRLASMVLFQTNQNFSVSGAFNTFFGNIHAPNGTVTATPYLRHGSIIAGGAVTVKNDQVGQAYNFDNLAFPLLTAPTTRIIVGGSTTLNATLANIARPGGGTLNYTATPASSGTILSVVNTPVTGSIAAGSNQTVPISLTGTQVGTSNVTVNLNTPGAFDASHVTSLPVTVLGHASATLTPITARAMRGSTAFGSVNISNATNSAPLQFINTGGLLDITNNQLVQSGFTVTARGSLNTTTAGPTTSQFTVQISDDQSLPGATPLAPLNVIVNGQILDDRRVTAVNSDLGYIRLGTPLPGTATATLATVGADNAFTRITVNNPPAANSHNLSLTGTTTFRFGADGLSQTRTFTGTPNTTGLLTGSLSLTTNAESGVTGTQTLANVTVPYTLRVYSGNATWNLNGNSSWSTHTSWTDNLSNAGGGSPGITTQAGDQAMFGNVIGSATRMISLNGTSPSLASATFDNNQGGSYQIVPGTGGTLTINSPINTNAITVNNGSHSVSSPVILSGDNDIAVNSANSVLTLSGALTSTTGLVKAGPGTLILSGTNSLGPVSINQGTLRASIAGLGNAITNNGALIIDQPGAATFTGTITGNGTVEKTGSGKMTLAGIDQLNPNAPLTISGGTLEAPVGLPRNGVPITLNAAGTLEVTGSVVRAISGTGAVNATGDVLLGRSSQPNQFNLGGTPGVGGTLRVGATAVTILSQDSVVLGTLTTLAEQGTLSTINGTRLGNPTTVDSTKILTATGSASINGDFINNGVVNGPTAIGKWLTFTQDVKGAGSTTGNVLYAGSYNPGNSPAVVSTGSIAFDQTSILNMEIGGTTTGSYDQLLVSGTAFLDGTLNLSPINGFQFQQGQTFNLIQGNYSGTFDQVVGLPHGWNINYGSGLISVVPEPSTYGLLTILAIAGISYRQRARKQA